MKEIYVLLEDGAGTTTSPLLPIGVAVTSEEEAKKFVRNESPGYDRGYFKVKVHDTYNEDLLFNTQIFKSGDL